MLRPLRRMRMLNPVDDFARDTEGRAPHQGRRSSNEVALLQFEITEQTRDAAWIRGDGDLTYLG
jgi:hypothetical protein